MSTLSITRPPLSEGSAWVREAWHIVRRAPVAWMGMSAAALLVLTGLGRLPWLGLPLAELLSPFLVVAYMSAARASQRGEPVTFLHLGAGFRQRAAGLVVLGVFYMLAVLLVQGLARLWLGTDVQQLAEVAAHPQTLTPEAAERLLSDTLPAMLLAVILMVPVFMATWFAPGLVFFDGFAPGQALWWSLWTSAVNWRPAMGYSLLLSVIGLVAVLIPFGLGLLVFMPVALVSTDCAYRSLFVASEEA